MFQRILVGLDGSPESERTLNWVKNLASDPKVRVCLARAQVLPQARFPEDFPFPTEAYLYEKEQCLAYLQSHTTGLPNCEVQFLPGQGSSDGLLEKASDWGSDLIVLGCSGQGRFSRWLLGSVAQTVVRAAPCPVLIVKRAGSCLPQRILVPLDGSDFAARALPAARRLAQASGASLRLVTVGPPPVAAEQPHLTALELVRDNLRREGLECDLRLTFGDADEAILNEVSDWPAQLVVLASHGRRGRQRFWLGSVAERVVRHADCSVLVWKDPPGK